MIKFKLNILCALNDFNLLLCFRFDQNEDEFLKELNVPTEINNKVVDIEVGANQVCAIYISGLALCWQYFNQDMN